MQGFERNSERIVVMFCLVGCFLFVWDGFIVVVVVFLFCFCFFFFLLCLVGGGAVVF